MFFSFLLKVKTSSKYNTNWVWRGTACREYSYTPTNFSVENNNWQDTVIWREDNLCRVVKEYFGSYGSLMIPNLVCMKRLTTQVILLYIQGDQQKVEWLPLL